MHRRGHNPLIRRAADVLEALGIPIDLGPDAVARCVADAGIGFMFAPVYHPAMKAVRVSERAAARELLGLATWDLPRGGAWSAPWPSNVDVRSPLPRRGARRRSAAR